MVRPLAQLPGLLDEQLHKEVRFRAGGVVIRRCPASGVQQVLLVSSRNAHKAHYSFPAGKYERDLDDGFEACALRETKEEAGVECEIVSDLGWYVGFAKKDAVETRTRFFAMQCSIELEHWLEETQRQRCWVNLSEARRLTAETPINAELCKYLENLEFSHAYAGGAVFEAQPPVECAATA